MTKHELQFGDMGKFGLTKSILSGDHLYSAYFFAKSAAEIESLSTRNDEQGRAHRSFVISSITSSDGFLEACINELFAMCADDPQNCHINGHPQDSRFISIGTDTISKLAAFWQLDTFQRYSKLLDKYQTALRLAEKPIFNTGNNPFQDTKLVVQLRNRLVHFVPEDSKVALGPDHFLPPDDFELKYRGKFTYCPLARKYFTFSKPDGSIQEADYPFFPGKCLGGSCAFWAFNSSLQFVDDFFAFLGTTWYYHYFFDKGLIPKAVGSKDVCT